MKKIFRVLSLLLIACFAFAGCSDKGRHADETTTALPDPPRPKVVDVIKDGIPMLRIIRADDSSYSVLKSALGLARRLSRYSSSTFLLSTDWVKPGTEVNNSAREILIGPTNRRLSIELLDSLPKDSYGIRVTENAIAIAGTDDNLTARALYVFTEEYIMNKEYREKQNFSVPAGADMTVTDDARTGNNGQVMKLGMPLVATVTDLRTISGARPYNGSQGAATDGKYVYAIMHGREGEKEVSMIVKKDMSDWKTVMQSESLPLGHGNDMCYNGKRNVLIVTNMYGRKLTFIDPETLTVVDTLTLDNTDGSNPYAIAYDGKNDGYVMLAGGSCLTLDRDFNVLAKFELARNADYVGQGMDTDGEYIYVPMSARPENKEQDNIINVYGMNGAFLKLIHLKESMEIETLMNDGEKYYASFNNHGACVGEIHYTAFYG